MVAQPAGSAATATASTVLDREGVPGLVVIGTATPAASSVTNILPSRLVAAAPPTGAFPVEPGWAEAIRSFKRQRLEQALARAHGNRTHAARELGLQRTYLLRLIHELGVQAPPAGQGPRRSAHPSPWPAAP
jgi:transcriptional regulator with GAF, ATPase, and Fis domain